MLCLILGACSAPDTPSPLTERVQPRELEIAVRGQGELKATESTPLLVPGQQWTPRQLTWTMPDGSPVKKGDLIARFSATQSQQDLAQALVDLQRNAIARIGKQAELGETQGQLDVDMAQVAAQLAIARRYANAGDIAISHNNLLDAVQDEHFLDTKQGILEWRRGQSKTRGGAQLAVLDAQRATYALNAERKRADLQALELRAPHDGVLVLQSDWSGQKPSVGSVLWAGNPLATLPDAASMEVEVAIPQVQAQGIRVGNAVVLHPLGQPAQKIRSKISWVAAAAQTRSRQSPVKYLLLKAPVPSADAKRHRWIPGQLFDARVVLLHVDKALSVPNLAIDSSGDGAMLKLQSDGRIVERAVKLGVRGATRSQVLGGLAAGDVVIIDDSPAEDASVGKASAGHDAPHSDKAVAP